ncbi:aldo/keto reductase (plasmid) [Alicyclobacillus fastidiosus]|uniref:Aldo/keto reductase n=1 Tax=Alicyclobacillus fastidiosus TaxID=392011 RepID=A0ABY6ZR98_9BACL|nr:aldo/keto reductase [Alicyclobacillus fastidiosus]WAH44962.1 aldo/keto reductase [Alicyclobacillus fastidiosus]GMA66227.1 hypothetical protein GCM10025859_66690 [Alicyclobacillus fastidiosus]GMA66260.1 hypothetical protein GCM10025859_67020 [Alicyclobacillus fastidiosus]
MSLYRLAYKIRVLLAVPQYELLPLCENEGLGVIPWSPLRGGWLSGKFYRGMDNPPADTRIAEAVKNGRGESWSNYNNEYTWGVIDALSEVAKEAEKTPAQTAINWLLQRQAVTAPIIGARTMQQLENNLGASGWALSPKQVARLDAASRMPVTYPYDEGAEQQQRGGRQ